MRHRGKQQSVGPRYGRHDQPSAKVRASVHGLLIIPDRSMPLLLSHRAQRFLADRSTRRPLVLLLLFAMLLSGCATEWSSGMWLRGENSASPAGLKDETVSGRSPVSAADAALLERLRTADYVLLGELHDHPEQHRMRLGWLKTLAEEAPIALVLEHFDIDAQDRLNAARASLQRGDRPLAEQARALAQAAGFRFDGWDWALIGPVVEFAIEKNVPLIAGNLSSRETFAIVRGQPHPMDKPAPAGWTTQAENTLGNMIREGHCNLLPEAMIRPMMRAQRARDAQMAAALMAARTVGRKPVLLAGNGHVRRDVGVPVYLAAMEPKAIVIAVGLLEAGAESDAKVFDAVRVTPNLERPDQCEELRKRFAR